MLTAEDADIVRRDPALPGLAAILDPERLAEILGPLVPGPAIGTARLGYIRYGPHQHCRATCRLEGRGGDIEVAVHACLPEHLDDWRGDGRGGRRLVREDLALVATVFPDDARLAALRPLADPAARPCVLRRLLPDRPDLWSCDLRPLRYRPERRFTAELRAGSRRALLKAYTSRGYTRGEANARGFHTRGSLRVAQLLGGSAPLRVLAYEWLPGRLLREICRDDGAGLDAVARTGSALADLHAQSPGGLAAWTRDAEREDLASIRAEVSFLAPALGHRVEEVGERLEERLAAAPPRDGTLHGDFSPNQVLIADDDTASIIDLDLACRGDIADDLGNFIACVERMALSGELSSDRAARVSAALLDGYARTAGTVPAEVPLYVALQLFRRTRFPFRGRDPQWIRSTEALVARAAEILRAGKVPRGKEVPN